jgi:ComF family protein
VRFESLLDVLFPPVCVACDRTGCALCDRCRPRSSAIERSSVEGLPCVALGPYDGALRRAVLAMKAGRRDVVAALGTLIADMLVAELRAPAVLVPVPTTRRRRRARGFDQATALAGAVARAGGPPSVAALERGGGAAQHGRSRVERLGLVRRFIYAGASFPARSAVVLLDDVVTTGATLTDARATLQWAGVRVAGAVVVARTHEGRRIPNA